MASGFAPGGISSTPTSPFAVKPKAPVKPPTVATEKPGMVAPALTGVLGSRTDANNDGVNDVTGTGIKPMGPGMNPTGMTPMPGGVQPISPGMNPGGMTAVPGGVQPISPGMFPGRDQALPPVGSLPTPSMEGTLMGQWQGSIPITKSAQQNTDAAVSNLTTGPDRTQLAKQAFTDLLGQSNTQLQKDIRSITQRAAAGGRTGSGMYGSDLVDAVTAADKNRTYAGNQLAYDLANGTIGDRYNAVNVLGNLESSRFGQGQQAYNNLTGYGQQAFQNQLATQQQKQSLDDQQFRQLLAMLGLQG